METPQKRACSDYILGKVALSFLSQFLVQESYIASGVPSRIENILVKLKQDAASIKRNLERKTPKVAITRLIEKSRTDFTNT